MKTVVFKFVNNPGFGDNLRGLITLLEVKKDFAFELIVDFRDHVFENFLLYKTPDIKADIQLNFINADEISHHLEIKNKLIESFETHNIVEICSNAYPFKNAMDEIKDYLKTLLLPSVTAQDYFNSKFSNLPKEFSLFHYRFNDDLFSKDALEDRIVEHFIKHKKETSVVISTSLLFKEKVKELGAVVYLDPSYHTNMRNKNSIDTFSEFYLVQHSTHIYSYSYYGGKLSGFVYWPSLIYDIPITKI